MVGGEDNAKMISVSLGAEKSTSRVLNEDSLIDYDELQKKNTHLFSIVFRLSSIKKHIKNQDRIIQHVSLHPVPTTFILCRTLIIL